MMTPPLPSPDKTHLPGENVFIQILDDPPKNKTHDCAQTRTHTLSLSLSLSLTHSLTHSMTHGSMEGMNEWSE